MATDARPLPPSPHRTAAWIKWGDSALHCASRGGHTAIVRLLLDAGWDVDAVCGRGGATPLVLAAAGGHGEVAALLLAHGARAEVQTSLCLTPLILAARADAPRVVAALLDRGASVDARGGSGGYTALTHAALRGAAAAARLLVERGADVNVRTAEEMTPLAFAALCGHAEAVAALVACGADKEAATSYGTPYLLAARTPERCDAVRAALGDCVDARRARLLDDGPEANASLVLAAEAGDCLRAAKVLTAGLTRPSYRSTVRAAAPPEPRACGF